MTNNEIIPEIKRTPKFTTRFCKIAAYTLASILKIFTFIVAMLIWYLYDYFYAIAALLLSYIFMGIVRSKLLHMSIPRAQQEFSYSDLQIAHWFLHKRYCFENTNTPPNIKVL